ncbi:MAG: glutamine--fructose-6-phosphate transaminase (isomerizing), partial [Parachlamydia sp.]|nr:glutamine--fructose-6-phosphate transaminase (isomerizing) [Parachlamydia sp.]
MCGIFGYVGKRNVIQTVLSGLKKLEYRGYDSAGIGGVKDGKIAYCKEVGKISVLEKAIEDAHFDVDVAIAQTRWATHGVPNKINAHPHLDSQQSLAIVHNGIIENHETLRALLKQKGVKFISDTDSEIIAHLVSDFNKGDLLKAVQQAVPFLKGQFAFAVIHRDHPQQIIAVAHEAPLVIGIGAGEAFISSDPNAFISHTREVVFLEDAEIAVIRPDHLEIYDSSSEQITKETQQLALHAEDVSKGQFEHFTLKEIHEQPQTIRNALLSRLLEDYGTAFFEELDFSMNELLAVERILILACGTSWHAGYVAANIFEDKARIPVQVEIASEFRYKNPVMAPNTLVIAISQSGETADTVAAVRELKTKGSKILAICNVYGSTLAREADACLFNRAGPEIGVCSTKAFTSQMIVLSLFSLLLARMRNMSKQDGQEFIKHLKLLPDQVQYVLDQAPKIHAIAKEYAHYDNFFFLGRNYM